MEFYENQIKKHSRLPKWLRRKWRMTPSVQRMKHYLHEMDLHTVCQSANCPNLCECFSNKTATFLILGNVCTRKCAFCGVTQGEPLPVDRDEPAHVALATAELQLKHVVVTSVTRDDLTDGGADQFAKTAHAIHARSPQTTIETLIPDFNGNLSAVDTIVQAGVDVLNHNIETVPELYADARPQADYQRSLRILSHAKSENPDLITKSGLMLGLGESCNQLLAVFHDLASAGCDMLTLGQYLSPALHQIPVQEYITPESFETYRQSALQAGIPFVFAGPYVRSSYHAGEWMQKQGARV